MKIIIAALIASIFSVGVYAQISWQKAGILLLDRKKNSDKHIRKVKRVIENWSLPIKLVIQDVR